MSIATTKKMNESAESSADVEVKMEDTKITLVVVNENTSCDEFGDNSVLVVKEEVDDLTGQTNLDQKQSGDIVQDIVPIDKHDITNDNTLTHDNIQQKIDKSNTPVNISDDSNSNESMPIINTAEDVIHSTKNIFIDLTTTNFEKPEINQQIDSNKSEPTNKIAKNSVKSSDNTKSLDKILKVTLERLPIGIESYKNVFNTASLENLKHFKPETVKNKIANETIVICDDELNDTNNVDDSLIQESIPIRTKSLEELRNDMGTNIGEMPDESDSSEPFTGKMNHVVPKNKENQEQDCIIIETDPIATPSVVDQVTKLQDIADTLNTDLTASAAPSNEKRTDQKSPEKAILRRCSYCGNTRICSYKVNIGKVSNYFCHDSCRINFRNLVSASSSCYTNSKASLSYVRRCENCKSILNIIESLSWQTMEFCTEDCLILYQENIGKTCVFCGDWVTTISMGKYCVRFGSKISQFCGLICMENYKKTLKLCYNCDEKMPKSETKLLIPGVGKNKSKNFCSKNCIELYEINKNTVPSEIDLSECVLCSTMKQIDIIIKENGKKFKFCSHICYAAYIAMSDSKHLIKCYMCEKFFKLSVDKKFSISEHESVLHFCTELCKNMHIRNNRTTIPCFWCRRMKFNFEMIKKRYSSNVTFKVCSLNCFKLFQTKDSDRKIKHCDQCKQINFIKVQSYDSCVKNFCGADCRVEYENQYFMTLKKGDSSSMTVDKLKEIDLPKGDLEQTEKISEITESPQKEIYTKPVLRSASSSRKVKSNISSISTTTQVDKSTMRNKPHTITFSGNGILEVNKEQRSSTMQNESDTITLNHFIVELIPPITREDDDDSQRSGTIKTRSSGKKNKCKNASIFNTATEVPSLENIDAPTPNKKIKYKDVIVIKPPVVTRRNMFCQVSPLVKTKGVSCVPKTRTKSTQTDEVEEKTIFVPIPVPIYVPTPLPMFSAPVPVPVPFPLPIPVPIFIPTNHKTTTGIMKHIKQIQVQTPANPYEADLIAMAKLVADPNNTANESETEDEPTPEPMEVTYTFNDFPLPEPVPEYPLETLSRGQKHPNSSPPEPRTNPEKRARSDDYVTSTPTEPESYSSLKHIFAINAWKKWTITKNRELKRNPRLKSLNPEILDLTTHEFNYGISMFIQEIRKPDGNRYAPDTIYYLCLCIQKYLYMNGRSDDIFCDFYYEKFTECLNEIAKRFSIVQQNQHFIVTRVEEEHLWETRQLGAHSPHVLLNTLIYFNTKYYKLDTVEEHLKLCFSRIMKHWSQRTGYRRNHSNSPLYLRLYSKTGNINVVQDQHQNLSNPLRCPVRLYEFYLSKCPASVKMSSDRFYLQPERSCSPESPVWYSLEAVDSNSLQKTLNRVKLVKEVNIALLSRMDPPESDCDYI